jgi:hypothetical protein
MFVEHLSAAIPTNHATMGRQPGRAAVVGSTTSALTVDGMAEQLDWETIKQRYPELAQRLRDGDLSARVEFVRLAFGAEIVAVHEHKNTSGRPNPNQRRR